MADRSRHRSSKAARTPFGEVQDEIRSKIEEGQNKNRSKKLFEELLEEAIIETKFDAPKA